MKNVVIVLSLAVFLLSSALTYQYMAWQIDKECRKYLGWEYYSLYPEPTCSLPGGINATSYLKLKANLENPYRFDNQFPYDFMAHY
jgi:hypothetical protein